MTDRLFKAIEFFREAHKDQKRREGVRSYFDFHLKTVADIVASVTKDEDIIITAYGHDELEDVPGAKAEDLDFLGARVRGFIVELTDEFTKAKYPALNRAARKQLQREKYARLSPEAQLVKLADISANLSDLDESDKGFARMFIKEKALCLPFLEPRANTALYAERLALFIYATDTLRKAKEKFDVR